MAAQGLESFVSKSMAVAGVGAQLVQFAAVVLELKLPYQGFTGAGFVETSTVKNPAMGIPVMVPKAGFYAPDFCYANGSVNTEKKCAIRMLRSGGRPARYRGITPARYQRAVGLGLYQPRAGAPRKG